MGLGGIIYQVKMETNAKIIIGILGVLLLLGGSQYVLNPTGTNRACSTGWVFQESGDFAGMYLCEASSNPRYEFCADVWDTKTGKEDYWCAEAIPELVDAPQDNQLSGVASICYAEPNYGCVPV